MTADTDRVKKMRRSVSEWVGVKYKNHEKISTPNLFKPVFVTLCDCTTYMCRNMKK